MECDESGMTILYYLWGLFLLVVIIQIPFIPRLVRWQMGMDDKIEVGEYVKGGTKPTKN